MGVSFVRTLIMFALLIASMRIMGKRQLGELEPIELVVAVLISNLAAQPLQETGIPLLYGIVPVLTLIASQVVLSGLSLRYDRFRRFLSGKPSILIENGRIVQREMRRNRISLDELYVALRAKAVTDIATVRYAILEASGALNVLLYAAEMPPTAKDMSLTPTDTGLPVFVISDGRVLSHNLRVLGKNDQWLRKQLQDRKLSSPREVYLMTVDGNGAVMLIRKESG